MTEKRDVAVCNKHLERTHDHHTAPAKAKIPNNLRDGNQGAWRASAPRRPRPLSSIEPEIAPRAEASGPPGGLFN
jgi:hypothetical protein